MDLMVKLQISYSMDLIIFFFQVDLNLLVFENDT